MFYLAYRPKTVSDVDNSHVKELISKILKAKDIPHAFLFVGQKGTGKTSTARIIAKAVNCLNNKFSGKGDSFEPCNKCKNCLSVDSSSSVDVVEMDAASHRGIDEVRSLIKEVSFLPMMNKFRVFIIDEAHMITPDAFNALLKTLEEPPSSTIFILATTNVEKIPKTIASRCFIVNFGKGKNADIKSMLKRIISSEKITIDEKLIDLVAKHSDHSFRDATKLLEELVIQKKLSYEDGEKFLGILGKQSLLEVLQKGTLKDALQWIEEFSNAGGHFKYLIEELMDDLRKVLLAKNDIPVEDEIETTEFSLIDISLLIKLLTEAYNNLKISPIESIALEIAVVDFYNKRKG